MYKNIISLLYYYEMSKSLCVCVCVCVKERERERGGINREPLRITPRWNTYPKRVVFSCFFHRTLILSLGTTAPGLTPKAADWLLPLHTGCRLLPTTGIKNFRHYIFLTAHTLFLSASHLRNSSHAIGMAFPLSLIYFKRQLHILFLRFTLTGLSKFNM